jgi:hypothetical protein
VIKNVKLALEDADVANILFNGDPVEINVDGWFTDKAIHTLLLGDLQKGENIIEVTLPFGKRTNVEWAYLLGDFGVEALGQYVHIIAPRKELAFADITAQGLPFYGGNITYHIPLETKGGALHFRSSQYKGVMQSVHLDNAPEQPAIYPPYTVKFQSVAPGKHTLNVTLYGHRRNSFGPVHLADLHHTWIGPNAWRTTGEQWCYDYMICEEGILTTPEIKEIL